VGAGLPGVPRGVRGRSGAASRAGGPPGRPSEDAQRADDAAGRWLVSDGLGRHRGGAVASRLAVEAAVRLLGDPLPEAAADVRRALGRLPSRAAAALVARTRAEPALEAMRAGLTLLALTPAGPFVVHVGDARLYRLRAGALEQLTADHSIAWEQYAAGAITKDQLRHHPNQRLLTRSVGARSTLAVGDVAPVDLRPGDRLLLCTDGVTKALADAELAAALEAAEDPDAAARALVAACGDPPEDDATAVAVWVDDA